MFLRCSKRLKDGKEHHYWSIVENKRVAGGKIVQQGTQEEFLSSQNPKVKEFLERDFADATFTT